MSVDLVTADDVIGLLAEELTDLARLRRAAGFRLQTGVANLNSPQALAAKDRGTYSECVGTAIADEVNRRFRCRPA